MIVRFYGCCQFTLWYICVDISFKSFGAPVIMYLNLENFLAYSFLGGVLFSGVFYIKLSTDQLCFAFVDMVAF